MQKTKGIKNAVSAIKAMRGEYWGGEELRFDPFKNEVIFWDELDMQVIFQHEYYEPDFWKMTEEQVGQLLKDYENSIQLYSFSGWADDGYIPSMADIKKMLFDIAADSIVDAIQSGVPLEDIIA